MQKVYGPYLRGDGRSHVIHYDTVTHKRRTQSYSRYLMEKHLGRTLEDWEQVDHINGDCSDDRLDNLQIMTQKENKQKAIIEHNRSTKYRLCICPTCNTEFYVEERIYQRNQIVLAKDGPFCSKRCVGLMYH